MAGGDGVDGAHLSVLVKEAAALIAVRNTRAGWSISPKVADLWIGGAPGRKLELEFGTNLSREHHHIVCVALLRVIELK